MNTNKILIVDDDSVTRLVLEKFLTKANFSISTASSAEKGTEILKKEVFPIVITDINMPPGKSGLDFLLWIKDYAPDTQVIVITGYGSDEIKDFATKKGALNYFEKPVNLKKLLDLIRFTSNKAFSGNISEVNLFDFINIISLSSRQKAIFITERETDKTGLIFLKAKRVIHAEFDNSEGKDAFLKIMRIKKGAFSEVEWVEPVNASVNMHSAALLMETFRIIENEKVSNTKKRILIVDDDPITPLIIEKYLSMQGFDVITAESATEGAEIIKSNFTDLVITDLNMPEVNGLEFMLWIKEHSPRTNVIIITAFGSHAVKKFANQKGALNYFEKPVNLKELNNYIQDSFKDTGFSGGILDITLIDFIQMIILSKSKKLISVMDPVINSEGKIYIDNGNIIHAESKKLSGKEAFFSIIKMKSGMFFDLPWFEPIETTIKADFHQLILEEAIITDKENLKLIKEADISKVEEIAVVRARPKFLERIVERNEALTILQKETNPIKQLSIYESGVALGIILGKTTKDEVIMEMVKYSKVSASSQRESQVFIFDDISVMIIFNENGIADEINFGGAYKGKTNLGIGIGDTIINAIDIYGKPKICTIKGAVWENIAFFSQDTYTISSIRLRNSGFFEHSKSLPLPSSVKLLENTNESQPNEQIKETAIKNVKPIRKTRKKEILFSPQETVTEFVKKSQRKKTRLKDVSNSKTKASSSNSDYIQEQTIISDKPFTIDETGAAMNITVGKTKRQEVIDKVSQYSKKGLSQLTDKFMNFDDIGFSVLFDEKGIVIEMKFEFPYKGVTDKGIRIGDKMSKAHEIYGKPHFKSKKSSIWKNFAVFCDEDNDIISCIRLKKHEK